MKMFFSTFLFVFCTVFMTITVFASQTTLTLQPGYVYEFTGRDARVISHVNVTGTGRYQLVVWDEENEVTRFGIVGGRISVSGTGGVAVTPLQPLVVSFDSSRLTVTENSGTAIYEIEVATGQTLSLQNNHESGLHIRTNQALDYDYVVYTRAGNASDFARLVNLPQFSVPSGGEVKLTPHGRSSLAVYFPSRWINNEIEVSASIHPALHIIELFENEIYALTNNDSTAFNMNLAPPSDDSTFSHDYVIRGRDGHVVSYGTAEGNRLNLGAFHSLTLTPLIDGELYFPHQWLNYLDADYGVLTPVYRPLNPGQTITITNREASREHTVFIRCAQRASDITFDYVLEDDRTITFDTVEVVAGAESRLVVPAGAVLTLTAVAADPHVAVSFPDIATVSARVAAEGALVRHILAPGMSVILTNDGTETLRLNPTLAADDPDIHIRDIKLDYIRYNLENDNILSFGRVGMDSNFTLNRNQYTHLTNPTDVEIILNFPQIYDLTLEETNRPALYRRVLNHNEALTIENTDRRYHRRILVQTESDRPVEAGLDVYEFVRYSFRDTLSDFGESAEGLVEIQSAGRINLMPLERVTNSTISIVFPTQWQGNFRITRLNATPLHRIFMTPGERITIMNRTSQDFILYNNTHSTAAGYYLRVVPPTVIEREYLFIDEENDLLTVYVDRHVQRPFYLGDDEFPMDGPIDLIAQYQVTIFAARGDNLELWLPNRWARQLRL